MEFAADDMTRRPIPLNPAGRGLGIAVILLLHGAALFWLLSTDHPRQLPQRVRPAMQIIPIESPPATAPPPSAKLNNAPFRLAPTPALAPPSFSLREQTAPSPQAITPPNSLPRGFDFSVPKSGPKSIEELFPSAAERQRRQREEQARNDAIDNEKSPDGTNEDCSVVTADSQSLGAPSSNGMSLGATPDIACKKKMTLKQLQRRNDLYSPH